MLGRGRKLSRLIRPPLSALDDRTMLNPVELAPHDFVEETKRCELTLELDTARDVVRCCVNGARPHPSEAYPSVCFDRVVTCEAACTANFGSPEAVPLGVRPFAGDELLTGLGRPSASFCRLVVVWDIDDPDLTAGVTAPGGGFCVFPGT